MLHSLRGVLSEVGPLSDTKLSFGNPGEACTEERILTVPSSPFSAAIPAVAVWFTSPMLVPRVVTCASPVRKFKFRFCEG